MRHEDIWRAIDTLAAERGLSASGLARKAGLDATTFNPSKRSTADGHARWPSTESVSKVLEAADATLEEFATLVSGARALPAGSRPITRRLPLIALTQAALPSYFDEAGYPVGTGWDEVGLPEVSDPHAYAIEVGGDSLEPVYRDGDIAIVSPLAPIRRGDRVVIKDRKGHVMVREIARRSARRVDARSLNPARSDISLPLEAIAWMHRIVWVSQ
ncbi:S24 family peptidase [Acidisoma cladoniae]|jgi:phage repressor protein C with HTH and peptisase S24 domain|uniref:S24 family peptidase n=1 Tax=Acidisoma cladoniae TaxID=3040935 RepID=UPI00254D097F|nr:helix-turn-helix transcriptional regulator [Acidisoma sp. PAMC 29798]